MRRPLSTVCLIYIVVLLLMEILHPPAKGQYAEFDGEQITFVGQVIKKEIKYNYLCITLSEIQLSESDKHFKEEKKEEKVDICGSRFEVPRGVVCYFPVEELEEEPCIGMYLCVTGEIREYPYRTNPGEFDLDAYYWQQGIDFKVYNPVIEAQSQEYYKIEEMLYRFKQKSELILDKVFLETESSMMKSILLGDKSGLNEEIKDLFQKSGISHILAISGLHIAMIGGIFYKGLKRLRCPIWISTILAIIMILLYGILTGLPISAFRAIVMFLLRVLADLTGRTYDSFTAIMLAACLVAMKEPALLMSAGMQLSFGAVLGISLFSPFWNGKKLKILHGPLSIFIVTFPIIIYHYYEYSLCSVFLNLIVVPLMSFVMVLGLVVLALGFVSIPLAVVPAKMIALVLILYQKLSVVFSSIPGNSWVIGRPKLWQMCLYYAVLIFLVVSYKNLSRRLSLVWMVVNLCMICIRCYPYPSLTMLDVGQGDGIVLIDQKGQCITIDGGSSSKENVGKNILIPFLKSQGIDKIEYAVLTHLDSDHYTGVQEILEHPEWGIHIENLVLGITVKEIGEVNTIYEELICIAESVNTQVLYIEEGDAIYMQGFFLTCLWPGNAIKELDVNGNSVVLEISADGFTGLLTGDISIDQEREIVTKLSYQSYTWIKAAHHGSKYSNGEEFYQITDPKNIWISCGKDNVYGHPHKEALQRMEETGAVIYNTSESGGGTIIMN